MTTNSNSNEWRAARAVEDLLAQLIDIDDNRKEIKKLSFAIGDNDIYAASEAQREAIARLRQELSHAWQQIQDVINAD